MRALAACARGAGTRQQVRAAARAFVRRNRRDRRYLVWVLRAGAASSALAVALLGLGAESVRAELPPLAPGFPAADSIDFDAGERSTPAFGDLDGDGDLDLVFGTRTGTFFYLGNTGGPENPNLNAASLAPFSGLDVGNGSTPALGDLDTDGDLDLISGADTGTFFYFENTGSATSPAFVQRTGAANPLNGQDVGLGSNPVLGDLDGDGDLDLVSGSSGSVPPNATPGLLLYYANTGSARSPAFVLRTGAANPLNGFESLNMAPAIGDLDGDGDLDLVAGNVGGSFLTFENTGTVLAPAFAARTGTANPLDGRDVGTHSAPAFGDLDGDGDPDLVSGEYDGVINLYANLAGRFVRRVGAANPLAGQNVGIANSTVAALGDLDDDGDLDLVSGDGNGVFSYFENTGSAASPAFAARTGAANPLGGRDVGSKSTAALGDADGDGDLDFLSGTQIGTFHYFQNDGNAGAPVFVELTGTLNPFFNQDIGANSAPSFADLDDDGDLDVIAGEDLGGFLFFRNTNPGSPPRFAPAESLGGLSAERYATPALGDIDGDGDLDLVSGGAGFFYFENIGDTEDAIFVARSGSANPLVSQGDAMGGYSGPGQSGPALGDLDDDGDLDVVSGTNGNDFAYFARVRAWTPSAHAVTGSANPLAGQDVGTHAAPALADLDADGDADLVAGEALGTFLFFANTGTARVPAFAPRTGAANPLAGRDVGDRARPALGDLDGDGDVDLLAGRSAGDLDYFQNTGTATAALFAPAVANPFGLAGVESHSSAPALADLDRDGDLDLAVGQYYGGVAWYENTGTATSPAFAERTGFANPLDGQTQTYYTSPAFGDFDRDGDRDVVAGALLGRFTYVENLGGVSDPDYARRSGSFHPLDAEDVGDHSATAAADLDGDGDTDLVTGTLSGTFAVHYFPEPARALLLSAGIALLSLLDRLRRARCSRP